LPRQPQAIVNGQNGRRIPPASSWRSPPPISKLAPTGLNVLR
jgi:hypothetical protein